MSRRRSKTKKRSRNPSEGEASEGMPFLDDEQDDADMGAGWSASELDDGVLDNEYYDDMDLDFPFSGHHRRRAGYRDIDDWN
jgi:hypothetical protein